VPGLRSTSLIQPLVGPALQRLFENGIKEQDIIELAVIVEMYGSHSGGGRRNNLIDKQSLITGINMAISN
jgi:hypothetical protein